MAPPNQPPRLHRPRSIDPSAPAWWYDERKLTIARYRWHPTQPSRWLKLAGFATPGITLIVHFAMWRGTLGYNWWIPGILLAIQGVIVWRWPKVRPIDD